MACYAIGDIQGCFSALKCLLSRIDFNPCFDELWLLGDLVNRGEDSLATLRYLYSIRHSCKIVLGNHDLHLLAVASGARNIGHKDTFADVLAAHDAPVLLAWLQSQPLLHIDDARKTLMVHAGLPPIWTLSEALSYAAEVSVVLKHKKKALLFFTEMYGDEPSAWDDSLEGEARWRSITNYLTRMRFCTKEGELDLKDKSSIKSSKKGFKPWFEFKAKDRKDYNLLFGHWAALEGHSGKSNTIALDTGCVWGGSLTAYELETGHKTSCNCAKVSP